VCGLAKASVYQVFRSEGICQKLADGTGKKTRQILNFNFFRLWLFSDGLADVTLGRERTISTERPPLVGEVSANSRG
jgi:hypothetical protein